MGISIINEVEMLNNRGLERGYTELLKYHHEIEDDCLPRRHNNKKHNCTLQHFALKAVDGGEKSKKEWLKTRGVCIQELTPLYLNNNKRLLFYATWTLPHPSCR